VSNLFSIQVGLPIAAAKCAVDVSTEITKSSCSTNAAVSLKSFKSPT
jgi:hypothetical protein